jgi:hypothetical protein
VRKAFALDAPAKSVKYEHHVRLSREVTAQLVSAVAAVEPAVNRNYLLHHKQGGSRSRKGTGTP